MADFKYEIGGSLLGYPIVAVDNPFVTINLPTNIQIKADLSEGPINLANLLAGGAAYVPPSVPGTIG